MPLEEEPFAYRETGDGRVMIEWNGRRAAVLTGARAGRFLASVDGAGPERLQLEMARVTGNFKRGNERRGG
ncbi:MAG: hypothetical protein H0V25_12120 [Solirubrobacterales bacterium]|nr:hypothetical protein [Solirubrobacterales bacterium]